jgi:hypothetical protein
MQVIQGTVTKNTDPAQSGLVVTAIHRETGAILGTTVASVVDGSYTLTLADGDLAGKVIVIVTDEALFLNAWPRAQDKISPIPV